jgi:Ser/Thr protein kinase RdoA (MazF antagonist)
VGVVCEKGKFLLKRRAPERRSRRRVQLAHAIQKQLIESNFPIAGTVPTRDTGESWLRLGDEVYELFEFVAGGSFSGSVEQSECAGRILGEFHLALAKLSVEGDAPVGSYHDMNEVRTALNSIPSSISSHDSVMGFEAELLSLTSRLHEAYDLAAERSDQIRFDSLPLQVAHGDWHPGNLLFKGDRVVAVMDLDSCRICQRICDVANGALQFSLSANGPPENWPDGLDGSRLAAFLNGYQKSVTLSSQERDCLVYLMIEALISEMAFPIARTGSIGRFAGFGMLGMVARKVDWIQKNADDINAVFGNG